MKTKEYEIHPAAYIRSLSGFYRPQDKTRLLNNDGETVGILDTTWSMDILVWSVWREGKPIARSDSWTGIIGQLHPLA